MTDLATIPMSSVRRAGNLLFLSGQLGFVSPGVLAEGGAGNQARQALANIAGVLAGEGATLANVVKATVWLTDTAHFADYNIAYAEAFGGAPFPARSTVVSALVIPGALIEIEVIAAIG